MLLYHQITSAWQGGLLCCFLWRDKSHCLGKGALELRKRSYYGFGFLSSPDIFPLNLIVVFFISIELYVLHLQLTVKFKERKKTSAWQSALQLHLRKQISLFKKRSFVIFKMRTEVWKQGLFPPPTYFSQLPVLCIKFLLKCDFIKSQIGCDVISLVISLQK